VSVTVDNFTAGRAALTAVEATTLDDLETVIEKGIATFIEVGKALQHIRDGRLYREEFSTFEDYLRERWDLSRSYAYQQMDGAKIAAGLSAVADIPAPASERVARELAPLKDEPEQLQEAWQETVEQHGPKPTAEQVREVVAEHEEPRAEDHGDDDGEQADRPLSKATERLPKRKEERLVAWCGRLEGLGSFCEALTDDQIADLERIPRFDQGEFVADLRAGRHQLGRLIRRLEKR
jgi:hypothetical protein